MKKRSHTEETPKTAIVAPIGVPQEAPYEQSIPSESADRQTIPPTDYPWYEARSVVHPSHAPGLAPAGVAPSSGRLAPRRHEEVALAVARRFGELIELEVQHRGGASYERLQELLTEAWAVEGHR